MPAEFAYPSVPEPPSVGRACLSPTRPAREVIHPSSSGERFTGSLYGHGYQNPIRLETNNYHRATQGETANAILSLIEPGMHDFKGYEFPAWICNSQLIARESDGNGVVHIVARTFLLGDHFIKGVGYENPNPWNGNEKETVAYIDAVVTPWDKPTARLLRTGTQEYKSAHNKEYIYDRVPEYQEEMQLKENELKEQAYAYRREQQEKLLKEQVEKAREMDLDKIPAPLAAD